MLFDNMKLYICFLLCVFATTATEAKPFEQVVTNYKKYIEDLTEQCIKQENVDPILIDNLLHHGEYVENRPLKCYLKCIYLNTGMLNENGDISEKVVKQLVGVDDDKVKEHVFGECKNVVGKDLCEKAFNLSKCTYMTVKELH